MSFLLASETFEVVDLFQPKQLKDKDLSIAKVLGLSGKQTSDLEQETLPVPLIWRRGAGLAESLWHFVGLLWVHTQAGWQKTKLYCSQFSQICSFVHSQEPAMNTGYMTLQDERKVNVWMWIQSLLKCYSFGTAVPVPPLWNMPVKSRPNDYGSLWSHSIWMFWEACLWTSFSSQNLSRDIRN